MFVPPASYASYLYPLFPAQPQPLPPAFTFAQSQSHNYLHLGMDIADQAEKSLGMLVWTETSDSCFNGAALTMPQLAYKSPLQQIGEALRAPRTVPAATALSLEAGLPQVPAEENADTREFPNYSYKLLPGGQGSPTCSTTTRDGCNGSGRRLHKKRIDTQFADTCLLSSLSRNPRTRAPFKPQKAGRGTSSWQLKQYAEATLGSGSLRKAVKLPEGEDKDEWLAVNSAKRVHPCRKESH